MTTSAKDLEPLEIVKTFLSGKTSAFTSNNMFDIEGHINCVKSVTEFKHQLPPSAEILYEDNLKDERGTRWLLIGKL